MKKEEFSGGSVYYNKYGQLTNRFDPEHHIDGDKTGKQLILLKSGEIIFDLNRMVITTARY